MLTKEKNNKTYGRQTTHLILDVYETGKDIFTLDQARAITGLKGQSLLNFVSRLTGRGILTRLRSGLYKIVPLQMGHMNQYMGDPYIVAREIIFQKLKTHKAPYCISHASAMDLHQMVTQPQLVVYALVPKQIRDQSILGTRFHFVTTPPDQIFGVKKHWVNKTEFVMVSDVERTVLDGLKMPKHCGGITDVAKGLWIKRNEIDPKKLVHYAVKMNVGAVYRRLGYLLETYEIAAVPEIQRLQKRLTPTYLRLDPLLSDEGKMNSRWKLKLNILEDELLAVIRS